jgi:hypothetical protein
MLWHAVGAVFSSTGIRLVGRRCFGWVRSATATSECMPLFVVPQQKSASS